MCSESDDFFDIPAAVIIDAPDGGVDLSVWKRSKRRADGMLTDLIVSQKGNNDRNSTVFPYPERWHPLLSECGDLFLFRVREGF